MNYYVADLYLMDSVCVCVCVCVCVSACVCVGVCVCMLCMHSCWVVCGR